MLHNFLFLQFKMTTFEFEFKNCLNYCFINSIIIYLKINSVKYNCIKYLI